VHVSLDLGAGSLKAGLFADNGTMLQKTRYDTDQVLTQEDLFDVIYQAINTLFDQQGTTVERISSLGMGIPGTVPAQGDVIPRLVNIGLDHVPFQSILQKKYQVPIYLENDANAFAMGEFWCGRAKDKLSALCLTIGTGIGAGVIVDGKLHRGKLGVSGEIGHIQLRAENGRLCNCGKRGCLETESSGSALAHYARDVIKKGNKNLPKGLVDVDQITAKHVLNEAQAGNLIFSRIVDQAAYYLGMALANIVHVIEFDIIVIGGGVATAGDTYLEPVRKWMGHFMGDIPQFEADFIFPSELGEDAALYGLVSFKHMT